MAVPTARLIARHIGRFGEFVCPACLPVVPAGPRPGPETWWPCYAVWGLSMDREQTPQSIRGGFWKKHEVLAALDADDRDNLREGDWAISSTTSSPGKPRWRPGRDFTLTDVIAELRPNCSSTRGGAIGSNSADVLRNWELLKQQESPAHRRIIRLDWAKPSLAA